jgi:ABC-type polysaccharide/polyol phosphate export permease
MTTTAVNPKTNGAASATAEPAEVYVPTVTGLPPLRPYFRAILQRRPFIWELARTQLKAEHYGSVIGQLWLILDPLILAGVYLLLRSVVRPLGSPAERAYLISHLIMAVFFFHYTNRALLKGANSLDQNKQMIMNTAFPRAIFPLVSMIRALLDFLPTLAVYFLIHALLGQAFGISLAYLPLFLVLQTLFTLGCIFLFAPLMVFFRDTGGFLPYTTKIWLFTTPVLYTASEIPENIRWLLVWNPLYPFFAAYEQMFQAQPVSMGYLAGAAAWAMTTFLFGAIIFLVREQDLALRL